MSDEYNFRTPENWTKIFVQEGIEKWAFDDGPLVLVRRDEQEGNLPEARFVLNTYRRKGSGRYSMCLPEGIILPGQPCKYNKVIVEAPQTYWEGNNPEKEDIDFLMKVFGNLERDYFLEKLNMKVHLSQQVMGTKVIYYGSDSLWTMGLFANREKVILRNMGRHEKDENVCERTENYAKELRRRGLEFIEDVRLAS